MTEPVTVTVSRVVRPGHEEVFRRWVDAIDTAAAGFAGHHSSVRLQEPDGVNHLVYQFDTEADLRRWEQSPQRAELVAEGDRHSVEQRQVGRGSLPAGSRYPAGRRYRSGRPS